MGKFRDSAQNFMAHGKLWSQWPCTPYPWPHSSHVR